MADFNRQGCKPAISSCLQLSNKMINADSQQG